MSVVLLVHLDAKVYAAFQSATHPSWETVLFHFDCLFTGAEGFLQARLFLTALVPLVFLRNKVQQEVSLMRLKE